MTVGDDNFGYSVSLHLLHPNWEITGTSYGDGSDSHNFVGSDGNLSLYTNVDARYLHQGTVTRNGQYDAVIFNNPYSGEGGQSTDSLIRSFISSAKQILAPGGEIHINVTQALLNNHDGVRDVLGVRSKSQIPNLPTFGESIYFAPYTPHYNEGGAIRHYRYNPVYVAKLKNFTFQ